MRREAAPEGLLGRLANVEREIADLEARDPLRGVSEHFHLGMVGGSGRPVEALDRARGRDDGRMRRLAGLHREREDLRRRAEDAGSGGPEKRRRARLAAEEAAVRAFAALRAGDPVPGLTGIRVAKKNRKSVVTDGGVRRTMGEITGAGKETADRVLRETERGE